MFNDVWAGGFNGNDGVWSERGEEGQWCIYIIRTYEFECNKFFFFHKSSLPSV